MGAYLPHERYELSRLHLQFPINYCVNVSKWRVIVKVREWEWAVRDGFSFMWPVYIFTISGWRIDGVPAVGILALFPMAKFERRKV